ncbi:MAG: hypothetical protein LBI54_05985 [Lachnospiraceae bacterium]|jgi:hypothetical protein|nr:hypothetical protein [Lachnospiraceae bacterium]
MKNKLKLLGPFVMLTAGAVVSIAVLFTQYEPTDRLKILLFALLLFYILGSLFAYMIGRFDAKNEEMRASYFAEEGDYFEKDFEGGEAPEGGEPAVSEEAAADALRSLLAGAGADVAAEPEFDDSELV